MKGPERVGEGRDPGIGKSSLLLLLSDHLPQAVLKSRTFSASNAPLQLSVLPDAGKEIME